MKKTFFFAWFFLFPALPVFFYLKSSGSALDSYALSIILGVYAFMFICNQFILASRPSFAFNAVGVKGILALHSIMPFFILLLAGTHKLLKEANGFGDDTFQATFGAVAWWTFASVIVFTVLFMANTFVLKIDLLKKLKALVYKITGLTYKGSRLLHNVTVIAGAVILFHVFLASSSSFSVNMAGIVTMILYMVLSLGLYFSYRLKGRTVKGK